MRIKSSREKKIAKQFNPGPHHLARLCQATWPDRARVHGRATQHGQAVPMFWLACAAWLLGTQPCALMHARALPVLRVLSCS